MSDAVDAVECMERANWHYTHADFDDELVRLYGHMELYLGLKTIADRFEGDADV